MTASESAHPPDQFWAELDLEQHGAGLRPMRNELSRWLTSAGVSEATRHEVLTAVGEACSNAVEHSGARPDPAGPAAWVTGTWEPEGIRLVVSDRGCWRAPDAHTTRTGTRGRGRHLMAALMDQTALRPGPTGTTVEMFKKHRPPNADRRT